MDGKRTKVTLEGRVIGSINSEGLRAYRESMELACVNPRQALQRIAELEAENTALRADSRRMQWLVDNWGFYEDFPDRVERFFGMHLREEIDKRIEAGEGNQMKVKSVTASPKATITMSFDDQGEPWITKVKEPNGGE